MIKLYIDIDGVLLTAKNKKAADHAVEFIQFVTESFDCFWLTTHCRENQNAAVKYLSEYFGLETIERLKTIKPANWTTLKTEAIDFSSAFIWLDDYPFLSEIKVLKDNSKTENLVLVDLNNGDELLRITSILKCKKEELHSL